MDGVWYESFLISGLPVSLSNVFFHSYEQQQSLENGWNVTELYLPGFATAWALWFVFLIVCSHHPKSA